MPDKMLHTGTLREAGSHTRRIDRGLRPPSSHCCAPPLTAAAAFVCACRLRLSSPPAHVVTSQMHAKVCPTSLYLRCMQK